LPENKCSLECQRMLLENWVKSVTIVTSKPINTGDNNAKLNLHGTRYFTAPCNQLPDAAKPQSGQKTYSDAEGQRFENSAAGLCIAEKSAIVGDRGFYFGSSSALWPKEFIAEPGSKAIFPTLKHLNVQMGANNHWSTKTPRLKDPLMTFERVCMDISPPLPKDALDILTKATVKAMWRHKIPRQNYIISGTGAGICYYADWADKIGIGPENNFFPTQSNKNWKSQLRHISSPDTIVEELKDYKFDLDGNGNEGQIGARRKEYMRRFFDRSPEGLRDITLLGEIFSKAQPPIGSLSGYAKDVEQLFESHLEVLGCKNWQCPKTKSSLRGQSLLYNIVVALGTDAFPILTRMEKAGMIYTDEIATCIGGTTPTKKAKYYKAYQNRRKVGAGVIALKDITLPRIKPEDQTPGRFFEAVKNAKSGRSIVASNNLGFSTTGKQVIFYNGLHPDIAIFLKDNNIMKFVNSIEVHDYDYAKSLLGTEHAHEVSYFLEDRLEFLQSDIAKRADNDGLQVYVKSKTRTIVHGMPLEKLVTKKGQRLREIEVLKNILENYYRNNKDVCLLRKRRPFDILY